MENLVLVKVTETSENWQQALMEQFGFTSPKDGFLMVGASYLPWLHGVSEIESMDTFADRYPEEVAFLRSYSGTFAFVLSLKAQFEQRGSLSEAQVGSLRKCMAHAAKPVIEPKYTMSVGDIVRVGSQYGRIIAKNARAVTPVFNIEITSVTGESPSAWLVTGRGSAVINGFCGVCGRELKNLNSIDIHIGPICADKIGVSGESLTKAELTEKLSQIVYTKPFWLSKKCIKEHIKKA